MASLDRLVTVVLRLEDEMSQAANKLNSSLDGTARRMRDLGAMGTAAISAPIVGALGLATKSAIDLEAAFTGVRKTVDGTPQEMAELEKQLLDLATSADSAVSSMKDAPTQVMAIAEAAGQLGVARDDVVEFTAVMGELAMTTDIIGEQGARDLAKFAAAANFDLSNVRDLGNVIVDLGNNFATTESSLISFGKRLATIEQTGFEADQILAYGAAMDQLGLTAEMAGTNFIKAVDTMVVAAANGGAELKTLAEVAGTTEQAFRSLVENDPSEAMFKFLEGLDKLSVAEQVAALDALGLKGSEAQRVLRTLAAGNTDLAAALATANGAMTDSTALYDEAIMRSQDAQGAINAFNNVMQVLGKEFGEVLLPTLKQFLGAVTNLARSFMNLPDPVQRIIVVVGLLVAAIFPLIMIFGQLAISMSALGLSFAGLKAGVVATAVGFKGLAVSIGAAVLAAAPFIAIAAGIATAIALVVKLVATIIERLGGWSEIMKTLTGLFEQFKSAISTWVTNAGNKLSEWFQNAIKDVSNFGSAIKDGVINAFKVVGQAISNFANQFVQIGAAIVSGLANGIASKISDVVNAVRNMGEQAMNSVRNLLGIASPSKEFMKIGQQAAQGLNQGFQQAANLAKSAERQLIPGSSQGQPMRSASMAGSGNVNIGQINVPPGTTQQQIEHIMREIGRQARRNGA